MEDWSVLMPGYEAVPLPSKGKLYQDHSNEDFRSGWVNVRQYTAREEGLISQLGPERVHRQRMINNILDSCIQGDDVKAKDLTDEDAFYLVVWLRANSYSPIYPIGLSCPICDDPTFRTYYIDLSDLQVNYLQGDVKEPTEVTLPASKLKVFCRALRRGDVIKVYNRMPDVKTYYKAEGDPFQQLRRAYTADYVVTSEGEQVSDILMLEDLFLNFLPAKDSFYLDEQLGKLFFHGVDPRVTVTCPSCGSSIPTAIPPTSDEFFRPTFLGLSGEGEHAEGDTGSVGDRTRFGSPISKDSSAVGEEEVDRDDQRGTGE